MVLWPLTVQSKKQSKKNNFHSLLSSFKLLMVFNSILGENFLGYFCCFRNKSALNICNISTVLDVWINVSMCCFFPSSEISLNHNPQMFWWCLWYKAECHSKNFIILTHIELKTVQRCFSSCSSLDNVKIWFLTSLGVGLFSILTDSCHIKRPSPEEVIIDETHHFIIDINTQAYS